MKKIGLFIIVLILNFSLIFAQDEKEVVVTGLGKTEEEAILQAKREAVREGLGVFISSETVVENFMLKYDKITTRTYGFVKKYEILSKTTTPDNLIEVKIKAIVTLNSIISDKEAMRILLESLGNPKVAVILNNEIAEAEIVNILLDKGFNVLDPDQLKEIRKKEVITSEEIEGNKKLASYLKTRFGVDIIITGKVKTSSKKTPLLGDMLSNQVVITLKAINVNNAKILSAISTSAAFPHIDPEVGIQKAIKKALAKDFLPKFMIKVFDDFANQQNNGIDIVLKAYGVNSFKEYKALKNFLMGIKKIQKVDKRNWNKSVGFCEFDIKFLGPSAEDLADILDSKSIGDKTIEIKDFSRGVLEIQLK